MCLLTVKQAGTDATYTGIVIAGIAVTGIIVRWLFIAMYLTVHSRFEVPGILFSDMNW